MKVSKHDGSSCRRNDVTWQHQLIFRDQFSSR
jgi:hypothetical protein